MAFLSRLADHARSPGDPRTIRTGPSVRPVPDQMARLLGWFSIGLGVAELVAPHAITRLLGMQGREGLVRAFGAREIAAGMTSLSTEKAAGLWSRVGGDMMDIAALMTAYRDDNPQKQNVGIVLAAIAAITLIDLGAAGGTSVTHARGKGERRNYGDRSGFPQGVDQARGSAASRNPANA